MRYTTEELKRLATQQTDCDGCINEKTGNCKPAPIDGTADCKNYRETKTAKTMKELAAEVLALREENGRMRGQIAEAIAIMENGTGYEKKHVVGILQNAIAKIDGKTTEGEPK